MEKESGTLETILTLQEVADWLKITPRAVLRYAVPCIDLGHKTKRFLARDVLAWLEAQRRGASVNRLGSTTTNARVLGGNQ